WPKTKEVPALLAAAIASTASLIAANTRVAPGTLSRMTAVANVTSSATAACPHATPRRSSLTIQARASRAKMPSADWRFSIAPLRQARLDSAGEANSDLRWYLEENAGRQSCCKAVKNAPRKRGGQRRRE